MRYGGLARAFQVFICIFLVSILIFFIRCQPGETGPGGPILVISDISKNPFSRYSVEILKAEGFNEFDVAEIDDLSARGLANYDVILLGDIPVSATQFSILTNWVKKGGLLISFRPDVNMQELFGIKHIGIAPIADKYLLIKNDGPGAGIVNETIQYHGEADVYSLTHASTLANLYSDATTSTSYPAVTANSVGSGTTVAFAFDLCRSIVYTRQGNPLWQGQKRDGAIDPIRSDDMFYPDWIDFKKIDIPQADEQQRFLANIILKAKNTIHKPLPRFWYLPKGLKAAVVMTGDDHNGFGTPARFDRYFELGPNTDEDIADWNAIRATSYVYPTNPMTNDQVAMYEKQGFEIALHLTTMCNNWTPKSLDDEWVSQLAKFEERYPELPHPVTNRMHCLVWSDWASQPKIESQHGIRLNTTYYYWPGPWVKNRPGFFTGSGMPMRFADINGSIINSYQAATQMVDESEINYTTFVNHLLDRAIGKEGYYNVIVTNMHTDQARHPGSDIIVASAMERKIPVVSAKQMLTWLDGRNNSSFGSIRWDGNELSFFILAAPGSRNMKAMLPVSVNTQKLRSILRNGIQIPFVTEVIKGINYAFFDAVTGNYSANYEEDIVHPTIKNITITPRYNGTTVSWTTDKLSDSKIVFGTSLINLSSVESDPLIKTNHSITLHGLNVGTRYYFRVSSADESGNTTTETSLAKDALSFTTPGPVFISGQKMLAGNSSLTKAGSAYISDSAFGKVSLKPIYFQHFAGNTIPSDMHSIISGLGNCIFSEGIANLDGYKLMTNALFVPGSSLEFEAIFRKDTKQDIGFSFGNYFDSLSVSIGTNDSLNGVYAKANGKEAFLLYSSDFELPHRYRIEWKATRFIFFVDGKEAATIEYSVTRSMHVMLSDFSMNKASLTTNWIKVSPYAFTTASFVSQVYDAEKNKTWDVVSWNADTPKGTAIKVFIRYGNTRIPGKRWSPFREILNGEKVNEKSRCIQYRVDLVTEDLNVTPVFSDIAISEKLY